MKLSYGDKVIWRHLVWLSGDRVADVFDSWSFRERKRCIVVVFSPLVSAAPCRRRAVPVPESWEWSSYHGDTIAVYESRKGCFCCSSVLFGDILFS